MKLTLTEIISEVQKTGIIGIANASLRSSYIRESQGTVARMVDCYYDSRVKSNLSDAYYDTFRLNNLAVVESKRMYTTGMDTSNRQIIGTSDHANNPAVWSQYMTLSDGNKYCITAELPYSDIGYHVPSQLVYGVNEGEQFKYKLRGYIRDIIDSDGKSLYRRHTYEDPMMVVITLQLTASHGGWCKFEEVFKSYNNEFLEEIETRAASKEAVVEEAVEEEATEEAEDVVEEIVDPKEEAKATMLEILDNIEKLVGLYREILSK